MSEDDLNNEQWSSHANLGIYFNIIIVYIQFFEVFKVYNISLSLT